MRYQNVCVESLAYTLPDEIVTSDEIEAGCSRSTRACGCPRDAWS